MEVWVTKYALSDGIKKMEEPETWRDDYVADRAQKYRQIHKLGTEAFCDEEAAKANAEDRRIKKIASLEKQIKKLKAMRF